MRKQWRIEYTRRASSLSRIELRSSIVAVDVEQAADQWRQGDQPASIAAQRAQQTKTIRIDKAQVLQAQAHRSPVDYRGFNEARASP